MAIRITGMYSGLDTESIINELASAQSYKKNKLVKAQTKLSWKQDAWKSLNTKIYSFYQKLDDMRLQSSYLKKKTTVSNPNALQVTGGNVDGSHKVSVERLSRQASMTSGSLANGDKYYTGEVPLKVLNGNADFGSGSIRISSKTGEFVDISVSADMTVNDFVKAINNNSGVKASYDQDNQRIYLSSWASGENGEFFLTGNDAAGTAALNALKLMSASDLEKMTAEGGEYDVWSKYATFGSSTHYTQEYRKLIEEETLRRIKAMKAENDWLTEGNKNLVSAMQKNLDTLKEVFENKDGKYGDYQAYMTGYDPTWDKSDATDLAEIKAAGEALFEKIYGVETEQKIQAKDSDGNLLWEDAAKTQPKYVQAKNADGTPKFEADGTTPVYETEKVRTGGMAGDLQDLKNDLKTKQEALAQARKDLEDGKAGVTEQTVKDAEKAVTDASKAVSDKQSEISKANEIYSTYKAFDMNVEAKKANDDKIAENNAKFSYTKDADGKETYQEKDADGNPIAIDQAVKKGKGLVSNEVAAEFNKRVLEAQKIMKDVRNADGTLKADSSMMADAKGQATKVSGEDAKIVMNGVDYTSSTDTFTVNGMTITALEKTDKEVTVSTKTDTDGVYDMIKDFIKAYSELVNEMDSLYNAESSKGYEPLTSEEKDALSDNEIEEWEKKIKDSLLRRDSTLSDVSSAMRMDMMMTMNIGGRTYSLADFGIETQSYFKAKDNERNAYHILGDKDDPLSWEPESGKPDLKTMISKDPDAVMNFFTKLTGNLHDTLAEKMSATKMSSALTVYNDKKMKEDYDDYTDKIKKQEEKLNAYIDKWYAKFSAMETALAKLESKNNSLSSLFGG